MEIIVKSKNCDVPSRLKEEAVERINRATRIYDRLLGVEVVFSEEQNPRIPDRAVLELTARTKGHHIRAEGAGGDHREATDVAMARFERQLRRYQSRLEDRRRGRRRQPTVPANGQARTTALQTPPTDAVEPEDLAPRIVRTKRFELSPMLPEDAALQLELLDHDFFVFSNAASGACSVLYRRRDGELGLIEAVDEV